MYEGRSLSKAAHLVRGHDMLVRGSRVFLSVASEAPERNWQYYEVNPLSVVYIGSGAAQEAKKWLK